MAIKGGALAHMDRRLAIEYRELGTVTPYANNARTHSKAQIQQIADSIAKWGWTSPLLVDEHGGLIAGHGRFEAACLLGIDLVPVVTLVGLTDAEKIALAIADNRIAENAGWDRDLLAAELATLDGEGFELGVIGFDEAALEELFKNTAGPLDHTDRDETPPVEKVPVSRVGDIWILGRHRVMCGDSTDAGQVAELMAGEVAKLMHADPPYGMGKAADGVANDNLYGPKLDAFQMAWWRAFRPGLAPNGSAYIWGNAPDLWRLWYAGGLADSEPLTMRNELVWDKKSIAGMASPELTQFPEASERCLFFQLGRHVFLVNQTKDDYWDGWEPLRLWLCEQRDRMKWGAADVKAIVQNHMYGHWFGKSQWAMISGKDYAKLKAAAKGKAFTRAFDELHAEYLNALAMFRGEVRNPRGEEFRAGRPYFDNAHEVMRDTWEFSRVSGDERHDHATPKPVAMMERIMRSSLRPDEICVEPFAGSGSTLIGAHVTGRRCFCMELQPVYVDVVVRRWQTLTGELAHLASADGPTFDDVREQREREPEAASV